MKLQRRNNKENKRKRKQEKLVKIIEEKYKIRQTEKEIVECESKMYMQQ